VQLLFLIPLNPMPVPAAQAAGIFAGIVMAGCWILSQEMVTSGNAPEYTAAMQYLFDRITIDPAICNGKPTIRGKRITAHTILEYLAAGDAPEEILRQYPSLEPEDITAVLACAAHLLRRGIPPSAHSA
jgi:uncharacterized protein (DUF433 family)